MLKFLMAAVLVAPLMKSCGGDESPKVGTTRPPQTGQVVSEACLAFCRVRWSTKDTPKTQEQVDTQNAALLKLCPKAKLCP